MKTQFAVEKGGEVNDFDELAWVRDVIDEWLERHGANIAIALLFLSNIILVVMR